MIKTDICDLLGIEYPIFQGGMAWLGTAELAAAVSEGAVSVLSVPDICHRTYSVMKFIN